MERESVSDDAPNPDADEWVGTGLLDEDMGPSSSMAHLYRGEVHRMKLWRDRLDKTTNWAVVVMAAILTWAFSSKSNPHYIILVGVAAVSVFLIIEARRFRGYDMWRSRVRLMQANVFAPGLDPDLPIDEGWRTRLGRDYQQPTVKITREEAIAHRLRRVYVYLFAILGAAWVIHVTAFEGAGWPTSAAVGPIPGTVVTAVVLAYYVGLGAIAIRPRIWHARDELREEELRKDR